jgi:RNase adapter protein RapZ
MEQQAKFVVGAPLVIITGLSGAGKSTAMRCFEDLGCFCIDNLPPALISTFYSLYQKSYSTGPGVAVASDVRSGILFDDFRKMLTQLKKNGVEFKILYLDCDTDTLINRFKEVRRSHPLQEGRPMKEAIEDERRKLELIREHATRIIDTSELNAGDLREAILRSFVGDDAANVLKLEFVSFGFKFGVPLDADFIFDVRFLSNPFYIEGLSNLTGEDEAVYNFVMSCNHANEYFDSIVGLIEPTLPEFIKVGKFSLTVGIGCTGGQHRSVAFAKRLAKHFSSQGHKAIAVHRDYKKPQN